MLGLPQRRTLLRNSVVVIVTYILLAFSQSTNVCAFFRGSRTWSFAIAMILPSWLLMAPGAPLMMWLARTFSFGPRNRARSTVVHAVAGLAFALIHLVVVTAVYILLAGGPRTWARVTIVSGNSFRYLFYQDVLAYGAIIGIYLMLHYSDLRTHLSDMRTQLAEANLTALRAQLNPHFLFNTLNAVSALALEGHRQEVTDILGRLGDLLRTTLDGEAQEVRLSAEMAFVDDYIAIQRVRFSDRLHVEKTIAAETLIGVVPSLILQPIVENAVEHGVGRTQGPATVHITTWREGDELTIEVSDTGPGFPVGTKREGIGLANTRARLQELYGVKHRFEYGNLAGGGAVVRITIPFNAGPPDTHRRHLLADQRLGLAM